MWAWLLIHPEMNLFYLDVNVAFFAAFCHNMAYLTNVHFKLKNIYYAMSWNWCHITRYFSKTSLCTGSECIFKKRFIFLNNFVGQKYAIWFYKLIPKQFKIKQYFSTLIFFCMLPFENYYFLNWIYGKIFEFLKFLDGRTCNQVAWWFLIIFPAGSFSIFLNRCELKDWWMEPYGYTMFNKILIRVEISEHVK